MVKKGVRKQKERKREEPSHYSVDSTTSTVVVGDVGVMMSHKVKCTPKREDRCHEGKENHVWPGWMDVVVD